MPQNPGEKSAGTGANEQNVQNFVRHGSTQKIEHSMNPLEPEIPLQFEIRKMPYLYGSKHEVLQIRSLAAF